MGTAVLCGLVGICAHASQATAASYGPTARARAYQVDPDSVRRVQIITRQIVEPSAVVSPELSDQPVHPHLIEVRVVNLTIYLDPDADYLHQGYSSIDDKHFIIEAQRLYRSLNAKPARVIWGRDHVTRPDPQATIEPIVILRAPPNTPASKPQFEQPAPIPVVPIAPKPRISKPQMVCAELSGPE